jgi:hypothetical protein
MPERAGNLSEALVSSRVPEYAEIMPLYASFTQSPEVAIRLLGNGSGAGGFERLRSALFDWRRIL